MNSSVSLVGNVPATRPLPVDTWIRLNSRTKVWGNGVFISGGAPWKLARLSDPARRFVRSMRLSGRGGVRIASHQEGVLGRELLSRGLVDLVPIHRHDGRTDIETVVPVKDNTEGLAALLEKIDPSLTVVVDDGSKDSANLAALTQRAGARLIRHANNRGPAAARNSGISATQSNLVAFIDSDCVVTSNWAQDLAYNFNDPLVGLVAPRVRPWPDGSGLLDRYEDARSSLDMGSQSAVVRPGAFLSFVPSAAIVLRRDSAVGTVFDEELRLGEDVDLVWRMDGAGWIVRYDPSVVVFHRSRTRLLPWLIRKYQYGTSAPNLEKRHPDYLTPARISAWSAVIVVAIVARRRLVAAVISVYLVSRLRSGCEGIRSAGWLAEYVVFQGLLADAASLGRMLRREWWPVGWLSLLASPKCRMARFGALLVLVPVVFDWVTTKQNQTKVNPVSYAFLRLLDEAAYGSGVIVSCVASGRMRPLLPHVEIPRILRSLFVAVRPHALRLRPAYRKRSGTAPRVHAHRAQT